MKRLLTVALLCGGFAVMPLAMATNDQVSANETTTTQVAPNAEQGTTGVTAGNNEGSKFVNEANKSGNVASKSMVIDINTADAKMLSKGLKGVGLKKAEAIVAYRTEHGQFKSADDLTNVHGITKKIVDQNRAHIKFAD